MAQAQSHEYLFLTIGMLAMVCIEEDEGFQEMFHAFCLVRQTV